MNTFALIFFSAALGFGAGTWYRLAPRMWKRLEPDFERLKPKGRAAFLVFEGIGALLILPLVILPFGLILWAPPRMAVFLNVNGFAALTGAWITAFFALWIGNRTTEKAEKIGDA